MSDSEIVQAEKHTYVAPATDTEKQLVELWQGILRTDNIGITDNFFKIGGNSLKAIKLVNKVNKVFNINLSIEYFFETQTIQDVAAFLDLQIEKEREDGEEREELMI